MGSLVKFRKWIKDENFDQMNGLRGQAHYDWWMFPTSDDGENAPEQQGAFKVSKIEVEELKKDAEFMENYREGIKLQMLSYGWNTDTNSFVKKRLKNQNYNNYHIRLGKLAHSLGMFGEKELHSSVKAFADKIVINDKKTKLYLDKMITD